MGIPQSSPLSPVLFLFYNAELLEICQREGESSCGGFVDDANILVWGPSTEGNCEQLAAIHRQAVDWGDRHGMVFASEKYELMHFS